MSTGIGQDRSRMESLPRIGGHPYLEERVGLPEHAVRQLMSLPDGMIDRDLDLIKIGGPYVDRHTSPAPEYPNEVSFFAHGGSVIKVIYNPRIDLNVVALTAIPVGNSNAGLAIEGFRRILEHRR